MKKISIIVLYHGNKIELFQTLESLVQQDYENKEIIIMSTETDDELLRNLQVQYCNIPYMNYVPVYDKVNEAFLINRGSEIASGEYLCFLNAGSLCKNDRFSRQMDNLKQCNSSNWNYCISFNRYNRSEIFPSLKYPMYKKNGNIFPHIINECYIAMDSIIVSKNIFFEIGGMEESLNSSYGKEFILRLLKTKSAHFFNEVLVQVKLNSSNPKENLLTEIYLLSEFLDDLDKYGIKESVFLNLIMQMEEQGGIYNYIEYLEILTEDVDYNRFLNQYIKQKENGRVIKTAEGKNISTVYNCVSCSSCYHHCPVNAIHMDVNSEGFIMPIIDEGRCIQCGKCLAVCPTQVDINSYQLPKKCYAVQAKDEIRMKSSSGGIFTLLARSIIEKKGYVVGAVYNNDLLVKHIIGNREEDVKKMQTSKYVQSDITEVLPLVKEKLEKGISVLFTGCVCQIVGLKTYLQKDYENLYTVDVVCHGIPSIKAYQQYLYDLYQMGGEIEKINFRQKDVLGWKTGGYAKYKDGKSYVAKNQDHFLRGFLQNWYLRESCYTCEFKERKYSDITLGDFWGVQQLIPNFEDGKGTSYVTLNTVKGFELYKTIQAEINKIKSYDNEKAILYNPSIKHASERPKIRDIFFKIGKSKSLSNNIDAALYSQHFDIGLVLWWSSNHGNAITNYALYKLLEKEYKVLAIDSGPLFPRDRFRKFAKDNYTCSSDYYPRGALHIIEKCCDTLIVGSDQTWNVRFEEMLNCGKYYQLDFATDDTKKISYAASFGMKTAEPKGKKYADLYRRFNHISVREAFGVDVCKEEYGVESTLVLDPVFLLEEQEYNELINKADIKENEPYICAYLLNPTEEKRSACKSIAEHLGGIKIINLTEGDAGKRDDIRHVLEFDNIKLNVTIEEWLYYMKNSQYVITDSFHGTCFSIIFKKNFMSFVNRQPDRFKVFERFGKSSEHIGRKFTDEFLDECLVPLDYNLIEQDLRQERIASLEWLNNALKK